MNKTPLVCLALVWALPVLAQTPPPDAPMAQSRADEGRFRFGVNGNLGWFVPQPAVMGGAEVRAGWQFNRTFGAFLNLGAAVGIGFTGSVDPSTGTVRTGINVVDYWDIGALGEVTLFDRLNLALGPVIASGAWAGLAVGAGTGGAETTSVIAGGWMPGVDARISVFTGTVNPISGRRAGFNIGVDLLTLFAPNSLYVSATASSGGSAGTTVKTSGLAVGFVPTLTLGFDMR